VEMVRFDVTRPQDHQEIVRHLEEATANLYLRLRYLQHGGQPRCRRLGCARTGHPGPGGLRHRESRWLLHTAQDARRAVDSATMA
jgi:hypothetical protein